MEIKNFNKAVNLRFQTLIKNIKNASNSFYDSYLDLLEETIKYILDTNGISYDSTKTCGGIIKEQTVSSFLLEQLNLDEFTFSKLPDYIKKCNDHKHKKEKLLSIESIINYLRVYYCLINYYYKFINIDEVIYDEKYFISIFKETERLNQKYKNEVIQLKNELEEAYNKKILTEEAYLQCKELLSISELEKFDLEEQNKFLESQITILNSLRESINISVKLEKIEKQNQEILEKMKNENNDKISVDYNLDKLNMDRFLTGATKEIIWFGTSRELKISKLKLMILSLITIFLGLIITIVNTKSFGYYITYSLFENIWMFITLIIFINNFRMKPVMNDEKLARISSYKSEFTSFYYYALTKEKFSHKFFRVLSYISSTFVLIGFLFDQDVTLLAFILEILFIASIFMGTFVKMNMQEGYRYLIKFTGKQLNSNKIVSIVYHTVTNEFYEYDKFIKDIMPIE